jgi:hypothetical protein
MSMVEWRNDVYQAKPKMSETKKNCSIAICLTLNPSQSNLEPNQGFRGKKQRLPHPSSYAAAMCSKIYYCIKLLHAEIYIRRNLYCK